MRKRKAFGDSLRGIALVAAAQALAGQSVARFEAASVKPSGAFDAARAHAGMKVSQGRIDIGSLSLQRLIGIAYRQRTELISGPRWLEDGRFDIAATLPAGAARDQVPEMMQALLAERFHLRIHRETAEAPVYALTIAKGGPHLSVTGPEAPPESGGRGVVFGEYGGMARMTIVKGGMVHMEMERASMPAFALMLMNHVDRPVVDQTGLTGTYAIGLDLYSTASMMARVSPQDPNGPERIATTDPAASVLNSVGALGLKLEPRKAPVERIVVDDVLKAPIEN